MRAGLLSRKLDRLEEGANRDLMKFNTDDSKVLHLGRCDNPTATVQVGDCLPVLSPSSITKALMNWSELGGGQPRWSACWMERVPCEKMLALQGSFDLEKRIFGARGGLNSSLSASVRRPKKTERGSSPR